MPRIVGSSVAILCAQIYGGRTLDAFTVELSFTSRRRFGFKVYDADELGDFLTRLEQRRCGR
ncbi:hypothetical protein AKJ09_08010 [Labilithrix luteola]|uniref:Uncharacterized protein n=1 Tax=Labilithrix luteola TaxID=1391654 RepID=A0A0K1Q6S3_9BACT|nr:hypothetical protein [Labilithrix luteola]AKV01347.1 hypothetical protein AKJ09_08010 [Labilithrix luteola]